MDERFPTGHLIDGTYRVGSLLSDTDRAQVYLVTHLRFPDTPLVLKVASHARTKDFERDTSALAVLTSPCIARVCDRGKLEDGRLYRVVERLSGPSLRDALLNPTTPDGRPFKESRVMDLLVTMAAVVHEGNDNGLGPLDLSVNNLMFAEGTDSKLCLMRALASAPAGDKNEPEPDPAVNQQSLSELRVALESGHDAGLGMTATNWKPPATVEEIRVEMARTPNGPRSPPSSEPGTQIDQWKIAKKISETLYATVNEVTGNAGQTCVLKVAGPRADHEELVRHARLLAQINSPHVVRILDAGSHENAPYVVMERLHMPQSARVKSDGANKKEELIELTITEAIEIVDDMIDGAEEVARLGGGPCDFSLDHAYQATPDSLRTVITHATAPNKVFRLYGCPPMSGPDVQRELADCWSAMVALYELVAGRLPFPTSKHSLAKAWMGVPIPLGSRRRDVPPALSLLVSRVLSNDVRLTTRELRNELRRLRTTPLPNRPKTPPLADRRAERGVLGASAEGDRRSIEPPAPAGSRPPKHVGGGGAKAGGGGAHHSDAPPPPDWQLNYSTLPSPISPLSSAALSANGRQIIAVGRDAIARYQHRQWTVDPARSLTKGVGVRSLVPMPGDSGDGSDDGWLALTTSGTLLRLGATGGFAPWGPSLDRFCFYAAVREASSGTGTTNTNVGYTLVGGGTDTKRKGVVARLVGESLTIVAADLDVKTLLAATYLSDGTMIACGESGYIVRMRGGVIIDAARPCEVDLLATRVARPAGSEQEILVTGSGAWAFKVTLGPFKTHVEPVDTLSSLGCLAVDEAGNAWVGTNKGRILRRRERHWRRMNRTFPNDPAVLAIHASTSRVRAVLADGNIVLGQPTSPK